MNFGIVTYILGWILELQGGFMLLPALVGLIYGEKEAIIFVQLAAVLFILGTLLVLKKPKTKTLRAKEGFAIVTLAWVILSLTGLLPYVISKQIPHFVDALFETVSGYTTTGASILKDASALSYCMDFWHCFTIWIGGMGVLVFMLAILPKTGGSTIHIMRAESAGPVVSKLLPKMRDSAMMLYVIYMALTLIEMVALKISGLPVFDSICLSLSNAGTGGFGVLADGTMSYTAAQQIILTVFMILFSINFNIYFLFIMRKPKEALKNTELRTFLSIVLISGVAIALNINSIYKSFGTSLRHSFFQVATVMSTTGFASTDFNVWPEFSKTLLVILMFVGACAGSTCGGIKISRYIILVKNFFKELVSFVHPNNVRVLKMDGKKIEDSTVKTVNTYIFAYVIIFVLSLICVSFGTTDLTTNFTSVTACLNNIGPGLNAVGPTMNYASLTIFQKLILTFDMLIGRLELFPILVLLIPSTWRRN